LRGEADEITYNLHIMLRFDLEKRLMTGDLKVKDLPEAWNEKSMELLGVKPENDADGVLQDIHWAIGTFGYFPVYVLGNLYSAQFFDALKKDIPGFDNEISKGNLNIATDWMNTHIHSKGSINTPEELIQNVSGSPLSSKCYIDYLENKFL